MSHHSQWLFVFNGRKRVLFSASWVSLHHFILFVPVMSPNSHEFPLAILHLQKKKSLILTRPCMTGSDSHPVFTFLGRTCRPGAISQLEWEETPWVLPLQNLEMRTILRESHTGEGESHSGRTLAFQPLFR
jgi:hypothetical protein